MLNCKSKNVIFCHGFIAIVTGFGLQLLSLLLPKNFVPKFLKKFKMFKCLSGNILLFEGVDIVSGVVVVDVVVVKTPRSCPGTA